MFEKILNLFKGQSVAPTATTSQIVPTATTRRLIPDPDRVAAGFSFWMTWSHQGAKKEDPQEIQKAFLADLERQGMKQNEAGIPFDSPFADPILKQLGKWKAQPNGHSSATLKFKLRSDAKPDWEWYEICPNLCSHPAALDERKFECKADRMPSHRMWNHGHFISEKCKTLIESSGLTGLEFYWVTDTGRYLANQWFHVMATQLIWCGLNRLTIGASASGIPTVEALRELFPKGLRLEVFPEALRQFVPTTDFAFSMHSANSHTWFTMCCSARARNFLLGEGVLSESEFVPIWIWDSPLEGAQFSTPPDKPKCLPRPLTEPQWNLIQEQLPAKRAGFLNHPKQIFYSTVSAVLEKFRILHAQNSPAVPPILAHIKTNAVANKSKSKLPSLWERVLEISDNFIIHTDEDEAYGLGFGYEVMSKREILNPEPYMKSWQENEAKNFGVKASDYIIFAGIDGNYLAFDLKGMTPDGDCRVVEWCHDPCGISREWPSITQLLAESMELEEAEEG